MEWTERLVPLLTPLIVMIILIASSRSIYANSLRVREEVPGEVVKFRVARWIYVIGVVAPLAFGVYQVLDNPRVWIMALIPFAWGGFTLFIAQTRYLLVDRKRGVFIYKTFLQEKTALLSEITRADVGVEYFYVFVEGKPCISFSAIFEKTGVLLSILRDEARKNQARRTSKNHQDTR